MATKKVTVTLQDSQLAAIQGLVESGSAPNVSSFVQHAVGVALNDVAGWGAMLGQALDRTGGPLAKQERARADAVLKQRPHARRRRPAA